MATRTRLVRIRDPYEVFAAPLANPGMPLVHVLQGMNIVTNTTDKISRPEPGVQTPVINPGISNWLALHGFDYEPMYTHRGGARIWYWRVSRHNDTHRPRKTLDIPLTYDLRTIEIRCGRMWPWL